MQTELPVAVRDKVGPEVFGVCPHCDRELGNGNGDYAVLGPTDDVIDGDLVFCLECGSESTYRQASRSLEKRLPGDELETCKRVDRKLLDLVRAKIKFMVGVKRRPLNEGAVTDLAQHCLQEQPEPDDQAVIVHGVTAIWHFDRKRIAEEAQEIKALLLELPHTFRSDAGGGWSFAKGGTDSSENVWTKDPFVIESLFCLGIAAGIARWLDTPELWHALPGGVPYVAIF